MSTLLSSCAAAAAASIWYACIRWCAPNWCDVHLCAGDYHSSMANVCAYKPCAAIWKQREKTRRFHFHSKQIWKTFDKKKCTQNHQRVTIVSRFCANVRVCAYVWRLCLFIIVQWAVSWFSAFLCSFWSNFGLHSKLMCAYICVLFGGIYTHT